MLLSSSGRVRLGCCGVPEVLASEAGGLPAPGGPEAAALQRQDLVALGNLLLVLACAGRGAAPSLEYVTAHFSRELCHIVAGLLAASEGGGGGYMCLWGGAESGWGGLRGRVVWEVQCSLGGHGGSGGPPVQHPALRMASSCASLLFLTPPHPTPPFFNLPPPPSRSALPGTGFASWRSLVAALGDRVFDEMDGAQAQGDMLLGELAKVRPPFSLLFSFCQFWAVVGLLLVCTMETCCWASSPRCSHHSSPPSTAIQGLHFFNVACLHRETCSWASWPRCSHQCSSLVDSGLHLSLSVVLAQRDRLCG